MEREAHARKFTGTDKRRKVVTEPSPWDVMLVGGSRFLEPPTSRKGEESKTRGLGERGVFILLLCVGH